MMTFHFESEPEETRVRMLAGSGVLAKACVDKPFAYALKLRTGDVIEFSGAEVIGPDWIRLDAFPEEWRSENNTLPYPAEYLDVRIADIVWVMDAPWEI